MDSTHDRVAAIILAGGTARRLGGIDKTALLFEGRSLVQHAVDAAAIAAGRIVIVAPPERTELLVSPAGIDSMSTLTDTILDGGPVAATADGLRALASSASPAYGGKSPLRGVSAPAGHAVLLLGADVPRVAEAVRHLVRRWRNLGESDGVVAVDPDGRRQPLIAIYRQVALERAIAAHGSSSLTGAALATVLAPLVLTEVHLPSLLTADVDRAEDALAHDIPLPTLGARR